MSTDMAHGQSCPDSPESKAYTEFVKTPLGRDAGGRSAWRENERLSIEDVMNFLPGEYTIAQGVARTRADFKEMDTPYQDLGWCVAEIAHGGDVNHAIVSYRYRLNGKQLFEAQWDCNLITRYATPLNASARLIATHALSSP
jgi:hypothetical protein